MKAILKFDLDNPDDREEHFKCVNVHKYLEALGELRAMLRATEKGYPHGKIYLEEESEGVNKFWDKVYDEIDKILSEIPSYE
jgi:hypothetical protein